MAMTWIAAASVGGIVLVLLAAPAMDVRLTRRTTNPLMISALLFTLALVLSNIAANIGPESGLLATFGIFSGICVGVGLLFTVLACIRFALSYEPSGQENKPPR